VITRIEEMENLDELCLLSVISPLKNYEEMLKAKEYEVMKLVERMSKTNLENEVESSKIESSQLLSTSSQPQTNKLSNEEESFLRELKEESEDEYLERFTKKLEDWRRAKLKGKMVKSQMTTWEKLDIFSDKESEEEEEDECALMAIKDHSETEAESESECEESDGNLEKLIQVYSQLSKPKLIKILEKGFFRLIKVHKDAKNLKLIVSI
jgi:hypothetical protein